MRAYLQSIGKFDRVLLLSVFVLLMLGLIVVYTGSSHIALQKGFSGSYFVWSHFGKVVAGIGALVLGLMLNHHLWYKLARVMFWICCILLLAVLFQGESVKGAARWLSVGGMRIQPSELMKFAVIVLFAVKLSQAGNQIKEFKVGFAAPMCLVAIVCVLLLLQPNFSMVLMILTTSFMMLFVAGARLKHLVIPILFLAPMMVYLAVSEGYRAERVKAFLEPEKYAANESYQLMQSLISLGNGGALGKGVGQGTQKLGFIPESYKDAAFSVLGEEFGFLGTGIAILAFAFISYRGLNIAKKAKSRFAANLAVGLTAAICLNAVFHICVCTGLMPTTGQPLPFLSFGGTNLIVTLFFVGVLLNISLPDSGEGIKEIPLEETRYV